MIGEHVGSTSYYYFHDNEGSVVAVVSASGAVQNRYAYDPYGTVTSSSGTLANPFGYSGGYTDSTTGLVKLGIRFYNPATGTFTQQEGSNQPTGYLYSNDSPLNFVDPTGMNAVSDFFTKSVPNFFTSVLGSAKCVKQSIAAGATAGAGGLVASLASGGALLVPTVLASGVGFIGTDIFCQLGFT